MAGPEDPAEAGRRDSERKVALPCHAASCSPPPRFSPFSPRAQSVRRPYRPFRSTRHRTCCISGGHPSRRSRRRGHRLARTAVCLHADRQPDGGSGQLAAVLARRLAAAGVRRARRLHARDRPGCLCAAGGAQCPRRRARQRVDRRRGIQPGREVQSGGAGAPDPRPQARGDYHPHASGCGCGGPHGRTRRRHTRRRCRRRPIHAAERCRLGRRGQHLRRRRPRAQHADCQVRSRWTISHVLGITGQ